MSRDTLTILFDADCSLCQGSKNRLEAIDKSHRFEWLPLQDASVAERFPGLLPWQMRVSLHVQDAEGRVFSGAVAYREIGRRVSPFSLLGLALKLYAAAAVLPGFLFVAERVYGWIAQNRYKLKK